MRPSRHIYGSDRRRGVAMLIAIMILAALFFMALPFAVFMRQQHTSATQALQSTRARFGEEGAIAHAKNVLYNNYRKQAGVALPFPWNAPGVDSAWQFHVTLRTTTTATIPVGAVDATFTVGNALGWPNDGDSTTVDGYIRVESSAGAEWMAYTDVTGLAAGAGFPTATVHVLAQNRALFGTTALAQPMGATVSFFPSSELWSVDVQDEQAKININTAPYQVILNLLGYLHLCGGAGVATSSALTRARRASRRHARRPLPRPL